MKCDVCNVELKGNEIFRCEKHHRCDGCGTEIGLCYRSGKLNCETCHEKFVEKQIAQFQESGKVDEDGEVFLASHITCPYCGYEDRDSWEASDSDDEYQCGHCEKLFSYERVVDISYTSRKNKEAL
jgi:hypothetical protein